MPKESFRSRLDKSLKELGKRVENKFFATPLIDNLNLRRDSNEQKSYDFINLERYRQSSERLRNFFRCKPEDIRTLDDLNKNIFLIGQPLKDIILVNGKEERIPESREKIISFSETVNNHKILAICSKMIILAAYKEPENKKKQSVFNIRIPYDHNIIPTNNEFSNLRFIAVDWRNGKDKLYCPANNPESHEHCSGYANVLKDAVGELLMGIEVYQNNLDRYNILPVKR